MHFSPTTHRVHQILLFSCPISALQFSHLECMCFFLELVHSVPKEEILHNSGIACAHGVYVNRDWHTGNNCSLVEDASKL
jgi:hypothetical protein